MWGSLTNELSVYFWGVILFTNIIMSFAVYVNFLLTSPSSSFYFVVSNGGKKKPLIKSLVYHWTSNTEHQTTYKYLSQTMYFWSLANTLFHQLIVAQFGFLNWSAVTFCHQKLQCWIQDGYKCKIKISKDSIQISTSEIMKEYIQGNCYWWILSMKIYETKKDLP